MKVSFFAWVSCLSAFGWVAAAQQEQVFNSSTVFQLFIEEGDFDNALKGCEALNEGNNRFNFSLARIDSQAVFDFIVDEFELETLELNSTRVDEINRQSIWIGLRRNPFSKVFEFVDGVNVDNSFFSSDNEFPWDGTQPNGGDSQSNDDGADTQSVQDCVSWERLALEDVRSGLTWYDDDCGATMSAFLCRGEESKTLSPVPSPSDPPVTTSSNDGLLATVFLSVAAIASMMIVLLVFLIVREKNTLKMLYRELEALPAKRSDDRIEMFDENDGEAFYLPRA